MIGTKMEAKKSFIKVNKFPETVSCIICIDVQIVLSKDIFHHKIILNY